MNAVSKALILAGCALILAGLVWQFWPRSLPLGRLPGDIAVEKENVRFYFPLASSILVSILISLIFYLFKKFSK